MASWLNQLGLPTDADHLVLTAGAQHALATSLTALTRPGETVLVEELTYAGVRQLAQQVHVTLKGVPVDAEGLRPEALESACRTSRARVLYCMPRLQNPTSAIMSDRRRRQIAAVAEKFKLTVIEDDVYGFLTPERAPLTRLIPARTVFVTSLSKSLFPGLRLGCAVAPPGILEKITASVHASMIMTSPIGADLLCSWLEDGTAARIVEWKRNEVTARQAITKRLLEGEQFLTSPASPHIWLLLPGRWTSDAFVAQARARGVIVNGADQFTVGSPRAAVRVCIGNPRTRAGLEEALTRVLAALHDRAPATRAVV
jgi:DNA-binding transcriptional MocR family regulator